MKNFVTTMGPDVIPDEIKKNEMVDYVQKLSFFQGYDVLSVEQVSEISQYGQPLKWRVIYNNKLKLVSL